jgi:hypothetical protein
VLDELLPAACHVTEQYSNNAIEAHHGRLKSRLRPMRGLKQLRSAQVISTGHAFVQNLHRGHYELSLDTDPSPGLPKPSPNSPSPSKPKHRSARTLPTTQERNSAPAVMPCTLPAKATGPVTFLIQNTDGSRRGPPGAAHA